MPVLPTRWRKAEEIMQQAVGFVGPKSNNPPINISLHISQCCRRPAFGKREGAAVSEDEVELNAVDNTKGPAHVCMNARALKAHGRIAVPSIGLFPHIGRRMFYVTSGRRSRNLRLPKAARHVCQARILSY